MGMLDGAGLASVPADQVEIIAALGLGTVGDDAEVVHPVALAQQLALAWADADGEIAAQDRVLVPDAVLDAVAGR